MIFICIDLAIFIPNKYTCQQKKGRTKGRERMIRAWAGLSFGRDAERMEDEAHSEKHSKGELSPRRNSKEKVLKSRANLT